MTQQTLLNLPKSNAMIRVVPMQTSCGKDAANRPRPAAGLHGFSAANRGHDGPCDPIAGRQPRPVNVGPLSGNGNRSVPTSR